MVTLAPELPGGLAAVAQLVDAGVVVAIGHTDATYDISRQALDAGASVGTHLFNAMRPLHHREPGPVGALLDSDADVELIADGVHLHPSVLRTALRAKPGRSVLVTDAMAAAAAADGDYRLGQMAVEVRDGVARLAGRRRHRWLDADDGRGRSLLRARGRHRPARRDHRRDGHAGPDPGAGRRRGAGARPARRPGGPGRRPARAPGHAPRGRGSSERGCRSRARRT